jgi:hypothetical protein
MPERTCKTTMMYIPKMKTITRILILALAAILLAACGSSADTKSNDKPDKGTKAEKKDPREGYFHQEQTDAFNPLLTAYGNAMDTYNKQNQPCEAQAQRRYEAGQPGAKIVECHLRLINGVLVAIKPFKAYVASLEGDEYRDECNAEIRAYTAHLSKFERDLVRERTGWQAYAARGDTSKLNDAVFGAIQTDVTVLRDKRTAALANACYTQKDIDAAHAEQESAVKSKAS